MDEALAQRYPMSRSFVQSPWNLLLPEHYIVPWHAKLKFNPNNPSWVKWAVDVDTDLGENLATSEQPQ